MRVGDSENVLAELKAVGRGFIFVDDNIIADRDYAKGLFQAMIPLGRYWVSQCSIEIADDPELLALARAAGCRGLFIGIETTNASNLASVGKSFNRSSSYASRIRRIRRGCTVYSECSRSNNIRRLPRS